MGVCNNRKTQLIFFFLWIGVVILFYSVVGELKFHEAFRYTFDVGFNTGTGVGNISEKNEWVTLWSVIVMWSGQLFVTLVWSDFIAFLLGQEEKMASTMFRDILTFGREMAQKRNVNGETFIYFVTILWIALGTVWGYTVEEFNFVTALNYAVGIMSSTGSQTAANQSSSNIFTGLFLLTGMPIFALMTSTFIEHMKRLAKERSERPKRTDFKPVTQVF